MGACGDDGSESSGTSSSTQPTTEAPRPDLSDDLAQGSAASCVAEFSAATLRERAFAFDGTVTDVRVAEDPRAPDDETDMQRVTFAVNEWFSEGSESSVDIWLPRDLVEGDRLLVSGEPRWGGAPLEDAIAWLCGGFTIAYSDADAQVWRSAAVG